MSSFKIAAFQEVFYRHSLCTISFAVLGGLVVSVLATGPNVRGFKLDRRRWVFKGDKNPHHAFLLKGSKTVGTTS
jgi:hypothetical protein